MFLVLAPKRSSYLTVYLSLLHGLALAAVMFLPLNKMLLGGVVLLIAMHYLFYVFRWRFFHRALHILVLRLIAEDRWELQFTNGQKIQATLQPTSIVLSWLVVLHFKVEKKRVACVLFPDSETPGNLSRLRRYCLWQSR